MSIKHSSVGVLGNMFFTKNKTLNELGWVLQRFNFLTISRKFNIVFGCELGNNFVKEFQFYGLLFQLKLDSFFIPALAMFLLCCAILQRKINRGEMMFRNSCYVTSSTLQHKIQ